MILIKNRVVWLLALCAVPFAMTGCQQIAPEEGKVSVVVGLYPYAYLSEAIGGDLVKVTNLTQPGAEPHDLELTARQVAVVATSDLVIYQKGFQPAVDAAIQESHSGWVVDIAEILPRAQLDPHVWLEPTLMSVIGQAIADELIDIDPQNEDAYREGLSQVLTGLTDLDQAFTQGLSSCERRSFLTTHEAFGYLAERYDLAQIAISGISPDADPSPERIAEIHTIAQSEQLTTIFFETLTSPEMAQTIAEDLGLKTDQLDPLEGVTQESRGQDYPSIMMANLQALQEANACT